MNSEKATAVSPSSPLRARGPSAASLTAMLTELLTPACARPQRTRLAPECGYDTPAATSQARGINHDQKTIKSRRKEKRRRRTNFLSFRRGG